MDGSRIPCSPKIVSPCEHLYVSGIWAWSDDPTFDLTLIRRLEGQGRCREPRRRNDLLGPVPLIPNYEDTGYSQMAFEEGRFLRARDGEYDRLILSLGLRWDQSNLKVPVSEANAPGVQGTLLNSSARFVNSVPFSPQRNS